MGSIPVWSYCKCEFCGDMFEVRRFKYNRARRFCSAGCRVESSRYGEKYESDCEVCGVFINRRGKKYCSAACKQKAYRQRKEKD